MTSTEQTTQPSPWISVWLAPRKTIEYIVAEQPRRFVLLLACLGTAASFVTQLLGRGFAGELLDWRMLLWVAGAGVICGAVGLYVTALVLKAVAKLVGGRASATELRAVIAWSTMPAILGLIVCLAVLIVSHLGGGATNFILPSVLLAIAAVCGLWSAATFMLMLSRVQGLGFWRTVVTYVLYLTFFLLVALVIRTLLFQPFNTPSNSMSPTLRSGDYFFVSKFAYGYSHFSIPFSPQLFSGRIFGGAPARGDVVVFRLPSDPTTDYVKRVVGVPGDRIQMIAGVLSINDAPVQRAQLEDVTAGDACGSRSAVKVKRWRETLPNGVSYETLECLDNGPLDETGVFNVPAGNYFVMGDNRDNSNDSRVRRFGYAPLENMVGRVAIIYFSAASDSGLRSERVGAMVR